MAQIADAVEKTEAPKTARLTGTVSTELNDFLKKDRFKSEKEKGEYLEHALTAYAVTKGFTPKV